MKINFDTVHINSSDLEILKTNPLPKGVQNEVITKDMINLESKVDGYIYTFHTQNTIEIRKAVVSLTVVSKFYPHNFPINLETIESMCAAHFFHCEAVLGKELVNNGFTEAFLLPENFNLSPRCREILLKTKQLGLAKP